MKKTQLIYIALSACFFVMAISLTKIPGFSGADVRKKVSSNAKAHEKKKTGTKKRYIIDESIKNIFAEELLESEDSKEGEDVIDSMFEVVTIGDKKYECAHNNEDNYLNREDIDYGSIINYSADYPYYIKVNRALNCVTVYGIDYDGEYSIPYKTMTCSTGLFKDNTPLGDYEIYEKYDWRMMIDDSYAQYASRFNGGVMFHSVPYLDMDNGALEWEEYNKLGSPASLGCVRLRVVDAKWIYDNCPEGTKVTVYDDVENPGPLGREILDKLDPTSEYKGWDPTDPNKNNPWNKPKKKKHKKKKKKKKTNNETELSTEISTEIESATGESVYGSTVY